MQIKWVHCFKNKKQNQTENLNTVHPLLLQWDCYCDFLLIGGSGNIWRFVESLMAVLRGSDFAADRIFISSVQLAAWKKRRQTAANCVVSPCSHRVPCGQTLVSFRKHQRIHVGNVNIVIPFVAAVPPLLKCKIRASFNFLRLPWWLFKSCTSQTSSSLREREWFLIVQELPAALVDIKPNRPLDGLQQMLWEWRDYCLKTQWHRHPFALSLSVPFPVTDGDNLYANTTFSSWNAQICLLVPPFYATLKVLGNV